MYNHKVGTNIGLKSLICNTCIHKQPPAPTQLECASACHYTVSQKNIPNIFDCNLKIYHQILIIFGTNIPDTTCHQMTI